MMRLTESEMVAPVLTLFPLSLYHHFDQVPLGRKKIDLVCLQRDKPLAISVELKISDWRGALWQAYVNLQVANESYIAIWHEFVHRAQRQSELLTNHGVGLIEVRQASASLLLNSHDPIRRIDKGMKRAWYKKLLEHS